MPVNTSLTYPEESQSEFALNYCFRRLGFEDSSHFFKCLLLAFLEYL